MRRASRRAAGDRAGARLTSMTYPVPLAQAADQYSVVPWLPGAAITVSGTVAHARTGHCPGSAAASRRHRACSPRGIGQLTGSRAAAMVLSAAARAGAGPQTATYYSSRGMGNCSYPRPPADGLYVALSTPEYAKAARCGGYLEVRGPDGSVRVKVVDRCPGCAAGHVDLSEAAFARLARLSAGPSTSPTRT